MDGMPGISQEPVKPGGRFVYEFDIHQEGTYFYHSHMAMQEMAGMLGGFIMHPKEPYRPHCDKDFLIHLQEYAVLPNNMVPNTMNMEFNWLVFNGKAGPATTPLIVRLGDRVRIRFVNLGMDHHPMHLHGHTFYTTGTEGGRIPEVAWWPGNTKDIAARTPMTLAEFETLADANNPTLKRANALVRRSQEQARQAGLYPNPFIGYQGEEIRGGSFGGVNKVPLCSSRSFWTWIARLGHSSNATRP